VRRRPLRSIIDRNRAKHATSRPSIPRHAATLTELNVRHPERSAEGARFDILSEAPKARALHPERSAEGAQSKDAPVALRLRRFAPPLRVTK